jgi:hypothetical protein
MYLSIYIYIDRWIDTYIYIYIYIYQFLLLPLGTWGIRETLRSTSVSYIYSDGMTAWTGDQPVARSLPTNIQTDCRQISMPWVAFQPTIPVFERAKTFHALDRAATAISRTESSKCKLRITLTNAPILWSIYDTASSWTIPSNGIHIDEQFEGTSKEAVVAQPKYHLRIPSETFRKTTMQTHGVASQEYIPCMSQ